MVQHEITVRFHVAWWLRWYIAGVVLMCRMTGCAPNAERVVCWVRRSIKFKVE